ncbi:MAG: sensor histidine kinase N-terminal domain-containing protein [Burkholderiales bacterium]|nr:sensor histidine kinase N-terminal domain-containing protein [Burkholderiales bacterium]
MRPDSLRLQQLRWLLLPLIALLLVNGYFSNRAAVAAADQAYDRLLLASTDAIGEQVSVQDGTLAVDLPYVALQLLESNLQERVFYRVIGPDGKTLTGYDDLPLPVARWRDDQPATYALPYGGEIIHLVARRKMVFGGPKALPVVIIVGETGESRRALSRQILLDGLERQGLLIVAAGVLLWFGIGRSLRPLLRLRDTLVQRASTDLRPIDAKSLQSEVRPLIDALNQHTARIEQLLAARQRFLDDASHQLRTPLAEIRTEIDLRLRQRDPAVALATLHDIRNAVDGMTRLVSQMLVLACSEPEAQGGQAQEVIDLSTLARTTTFDFVAAARRKSIDLAFEDEATGGSLLGQPLLLRELIANLVDNAIVHGRAGGAITVRVRRGDAAVLEVDDDGPGIPETERAKVLQRFYRGADRRTPGSGLGLAIVAGICTTHQARLELLTPPWGHGLRVRVSFQALA